MSIANPAVETELARLIAEQEADDSASQVPGGNRVFLDASYGEGATLHAVVGSEDVNHDRDWFRKRGRVTDEEVRLWRYLRHEKGFTYREIADETGRPVQTVHDHLVRRARKSRSKTALPRMTAGKQGFKLAKMEEHAWAAYEAGASLYQIAELFYKDCGYASMESCYQQLRILFRWRKRPLRKLTMKHGRLHRDTPREVKQAYWKEQNRKARERRRATLTRCPHMTQSGQQCRRFTLRGKPFCVVHHDPVKRWSHEAVHEALRQWAEKHGRLPRPRDWESRSDDHPTFRTIYNMWPHWNDALKDAGLLEGAHGT